MNKRFVILAMLFSSLSGALIAVFITSSLSTKKETAPYPISQRQRQVQLTKAVDTSSFTVPEGLNFIHSAQKVIPGVVHIRSAYSSGQSSLNALEGFFRNQPQSSGSGVIISDDGYIATNNHVIEDASRIEIVLNDNRSYYAKVVGTDPTTDLALLKVDAQDLEFVKYGNSDGVLPGEWVLAIGNPFDLNSTVTAGIISAKARNIGILRDRNNLQIESFLQTDAAVNPGNSGGALVNLKGELIGINTAIATPNGSYAGYSFAVPVTLVKKVMDDLLEFGEVQRGLLGIQINDVNARLAELENLSRVNGVYISNVNQNSAAEAAGLERGDIVIAINNSVINNVSELQEVVARNRPGDKIEVTYVRNNTENTVNAILRNTQGNTEVITSIYKDEIEGALFESLKMDDMASLDITGGVRIVEMEDGKWKEAGLEEGFIITKIDKVPIDNVEDLNRILKNKKGGLLAEGIYKNGEKGIFGVDW